MKEGKKEKQRDNLIKMMNKCNEWVREELMGDGTEWHDIADLFFLVSLIYA